MLTILIGVFSLLIGQTFYKKAQKECEEEIERKKELRKQMFEEIINRPFADWSIHPADSNAIMISPLDEESKVFKIELP